MPLHFFLNYGGPSGYWFSNNNALATTALMGACRDYYGSPHSQVSFVVKGIHVTVQTDGIHRSLRISAPDTSTTELFDSLSNTASNFCNLDYGLLSNNCATSVATVLHQLDPTITPPDVILPWTLDRHIRSYCSKTYNPQQMQEFQNNAEAETNSYITTFLQDHYEQYEYRCLFKVASGKRRGSGERTKSIFLEAGWVTEDKDKTLHPTGKAPQDFKRELEAYNKDVALVEQLKKLYKEKASIFSINAWILFKENPDSETVLANLRAQAKKNPTGACAKVLHQYDQDKGLKEHAHKDSNQTWTSKASALRDQAEEAPSVKDSTEVSDPNNPRV